MIKNNQSPLQPWPGSSADTTRNFLHQILQKHPMPNSDNGKPVSTCPVNRRQWLAGTSAIGAMLVSPHSSFGQFEQTDPPPPREKLPVAAVVTIYTRDTHADVIVGKILEGFQQDGGPGPDLRLVSLYVDQFPQNDLSRSLAAKHGFRICQTINEAITFPSEKDQIAGVLSIGEHGNYPYTPDTNQHMYPRRDFFDQIVAGMTKTGRFVPIFSDKHLSHGWQDAKHMYDTAQRLAIPFMAGSSVPVTHRHPATGLPRDRKLEEALVVFYGPLEAYGFHALEGLQCIVEERLGGETGVKAVQTLRGKEIWKAQSEGRWSRTLLDAALKAAPENLADDPDAILTRKAAFYLLEYCDGMRATIVMANGLFNELTFAAKLQDQVEPVATWIQLGSRRPYSHFEFQVKAIEHMVHTGRPAYPVERTLLTTGVLDTVMHSLMQHGKRIETPHLDIAYQSTHWPFANQPAS